MSYMVHWCKACKSLKSVSFCFDVFSFVLFCFLLFWQSKQGKSQKRPPSYTIPYKIVQYLHRAPHTDWNRGSMGKALVKTALKLTADSGRKPRGKKRKLSASVRLHLSRTEPHAHGWPREGDNQDQPLGGHLLVLLHNQPSHTSPVSCLHHGSQQEQIRTSEIREKAASYLEWLLVGEQQVILKYAQKNPSLAKH